MGTGRPQVSGASSGAGPVDSGPMVAQGNALSLRKAGRIAGVWYLLAGLTGVFSYLYVPSALVAPGDAAATAQRIAAGALTYRLGILSDLASQVFLIMLVLTLYALLRNADRRQARLMVTLAVLGAAAAIANILNLLAPLILWSGAGFLSAFSPAQLDALAMGFLRLRAHDLVIVQVFWGLWLFPFGVLVVKSGLFPPFLGGLLVLACCAYCVASAAAIVTPSHAQLITGLMQPVEGLGEGAMTVWLLVKGARLPQVPR